MRSIRHTIPMPLFGYTDLRLTYELGMRHTQLQHQRLQGNFCPALVDIPNWDECTSLLELYEVDPETGELIPDKPLSKPAFPLTWEILELLPVVLRQALFGDYAMNEAARDYVDQHHPN
jgi:hypothetical protein